MLSRSRLLGLLLVALAASLLLAVGVAFASGTFTDDDGNIHEGNIEAIAAEGITKGCNPPTNDLYCPDDSVTRGQMAAFIRRAFSLPSSSTDFFVDDNDSVFEGDINAVAAAGVTKGCNPPANDRFCPDGSVTREQMAAFLRRAFGYPATSTDFFTDDGASIFQADINAIAKAGVTKGCNPPTNDRYCPTDLVKRDQMASFFARALGLAPITPSPPTTAPPPTTPPPTTPPPTTPQTLCQAQSSIPVVECEALEAFYHSTNGPGWSYGSNWLSDPDPCKWVGVYCGAGFVTELSGGGDSMSGTLSPELGDLSHLQTLSIGATSLSGGIPPELGKLTSLVNLWLDGSSLSGAIPPQLGKLTSLRELHLGYNLLSGPIPPELGDLANLRDIGLSFNQLAGAIPSELGNLTNLTEIGLRDNDLSGAIPADLGNLTGLTALWLQGNSLSGAIPPELGHLPILDILYLDDNSLSGEVPAELENLGDHMYHLSLRGQTGCLTAAAPSFADWLTGYDPLWNDGCSTP